MSMRIENQNDIAAVGNSRSSAAQNVSQDSRAASTSGGSHPAGDQVDLSSASSLVAAAKNSVSTGRQEKIAALTAQVRSGTYKVDAGQTSRALIQSYFKN